VDVLIESRLKTGMRQPIRVSAEPGAEEA